MPELTVSIAFVFAVRERNGEAAGEPSRRAIGARSRPPAEGCGFVGGLGGRLE